MENLVAESGLPSTHSFRVKGNNHLQVLDTRAQSGRSKMEKGGFHPPQFPIKVKRKRYLVPLKMLTEGEPTNPREGWNPLFLFFAYILEVILLIEDPKLHYEGAPLPRIDGTVGSGLIR